MGNSRVLQKATKELTKAKAPSKSRDIIYDPKGQWAHPGENTRIPGGDITMQGVPYPVLAQPNVGQPQMMYPGQDYVFPGADYVDEYPQMKRGGYTKGLVSMPKPSKKGLASKAYSRSLEATNRLFTENALFKKPKDRKRKVFDPNAKYYQDGGVSPIEGDLISKVLMNRNRGVDFVDRAYALGDNPDTPLFNVPDDEEFGNRMSHKMAWGTDNQGQAWMFPTVLNPNDEAIKVPNQYADYISSEGYKNATGMNYQDGGEYGMPLGAGVSQNFIGNRDEFNVGGIPNLPLRDNRVNYDAYVNRFEPKDEYDDGGYIETELTDDEIQAYRDGGYIVEDISVPSLNQYQDGGTYTYAGRKDSKYKKDDQGNWLISNKSTGNKFVPIKDPTGKRAKELNRSAIPEQSFEKVAMPSESTDTQMLKNQMKEIGKKRLDEFATQAAYEQSVIDAKIKEMRSQDFLTPDERRKGLKNTSKISKQRRNKAINDLKWATVENHNDVYKAIKDENERLGKLDKVKALPKGSIKSKSASVYDMLTNPLDAFKYSVSTGDVSNMPANYNKLVQAGIDPLEHRGGNLVGNVVNAYNPVDIGDKVGYYTKKGDFVMAGLHALRALPYTGPVAKLPGVARALSAANKYVVSPVEKGLKYAPLANMTSKSSPLVSTIGKNITGANLLKGRALIHATQKSPELLNALGEAVDKKDVKSLKKATELGADVGFNFFSGAPAATEYFLSKAAFNVMKPKQEELIHAKDPLLGGSIFDYLSVVRNLPSVRAKGGETKYVDTELTDDEIQDLIDDGYVVELL